MATMFDNPNQIQGLNFGLSSPMAGSTAMSGTQAIDPLNINWDQYITDSIFNSQGGGGLPTATTPDWNLFSSQGLQDISTGIGAASNLFNIYNGFKSRGLAEDSFNFNKGVTQTNLTNQANLTNEMLATRQASRLRSQGITGDANANAVTDFMNKYGVSGKVGG